MGKNSTNRDDCCESPDFNSIYTDFIGNPDGPFQIFDDILPSVDDTYNVGSAILRWKNGYYSVSLFCPRLTSTSTDLTLDAASTFSVVAKKSVVPDTDILHSSGFSNKRWLNVHGKTIFTETVTTLTGSDLTLSASSGQVIQNTHTIRPSTNLGNDLGTNSFRYANVYGQTINSTTINNTTLNTTTANATTVNTTTLVTTNINATTSQNLALSADTGYVITANKNIEPFVDSTTNLGSASKKWQTTYTNNVNATTVNTGSVVTNSVSANPTVDLTFFADSGKSIILNNPLLPVTDNSISLGSASKQWSDIRANQATIASINSTTLTMNNTITTPTGIDLNLTTATGRNIVCSQTLRPASDITQSCGATTQRWLNVHSKNIITENITTPTGKNLVIDADTGYEIVANKNLVPNATATYSLGSTAYKWNNTYTVTTNTNLVQSFTGANLELQAPVGNVISAKSSLWPFDNLVQSLGSTSNRWLNVHSENIITENITSPTGKYLVLDADTGYEIVANKNLVPNATATYSLGSTAYKWNNIYTITTTTNTVISNTSNDLTLDAATGQKIVSKKFIEPDLDNTYALGQSIKRWANTYAVNTYTNTISSVDPANLRLTVPPTKRIELDGPVIPVTGSLDFGNSTAAWSTVYTNNVASPTSTDLTLNPATGKDLISTKSFLPDTTASHSLGSSLKTWLNGFIDNLTIVTSTATDFFKSPADKQGTSYGSAATTLSATTFTTAPISINASTFDGTSNQFKFPVKGVYCIDFTSVGDTSTLSGNTITYRLKNTNGGGTTIEQYHRVGDPSTFPPPYYRFSFLFRCNDATNDRIVIEYQRSNANVSNWSISEGYCYRVNTFS